MKPLGPAAAARAAARTQQPVWLLELASGTHTLRAATRDVVYAGHPHAPVLAPGLRWHEAEPADTPHWPGGRVESAAQVTWLGCAGTTGGLRALLDVTPPLGLHATLRQGWLAEAQSTTLQAGEALVLLHGAVVRWELDATGVRLHLADELGVLAPRRCGRLLRRDMLGGAPSPSFGLPLPLVLGAHAQLELLPLEHGVAQHLVRPLYIGERLVFVEDVTQLPPTGRVQVGAELIDYTELDPQHNLLGPGGYGVTRSMPHLAHARGSLVRLLPPGGFTWLVADHPCRAVHAVYADGVPLAAAEWFTGTRLLGGRLVQVITLPRWPVDAAGALARRLTAHVEGWAQPDGALLENPADVLAWLLTEPRLAALAPERLDDAAFTTQRARLAAAEYRFARRIPGDAMLGALLGSAAREAGVWLVPGERLALRTCEPTPQPADVAARIDATRQLTVLAAEPSGEVLPSLAPPTLAPPSLAPPSLAPPQAALAGYAAGLPPPAVELVGPLPPGGGPRAAYQFPPETIPSGVIPQRLMAEWLVLGGTAPPAAARDLGELLHTQACDTPFRFTTATDPALVRLAPGDTVAAECAPLGLFDALAWVRRIELDLAHGPWPRLMLAGPWCNRIVWRGPLGPEGAPLAELRVYAFGGVLDVLLAGRPVARLGRSGVLRLRGTLRERAALPVASVPEPLWLAPEGLCLAWGTAGAWVPWLLLDGDGNAWLRGTVAEAEALAPGPAAGWAADAAGFRLAANPQATGLAWQAAAQRLLLAGTLIEGVRL